MNCDRRTFGFIWRTFSTSQEGRLGNIFCWSRILNMGGAGLSREVIKPEMYPMWLVLRVELCCPKILMLKS